MEWLKKFNASGNFQIRNSAAVFYKYSYLWLMYYVLFNKLIFLKNAKAMYVQLMFLSMLELTTMKLYRRHSIKNEWYGRGQVGIWAGECTCCRELEGTLHPGKLRGGWTPKRQCDRFLEY